MINTIPPDTSMQKTFDGGQFVLTTGTPVGALDAADDGDVDLFHQVLWSLDTYSIVDARVALGKALHTIQDFNYSNLVEMGNLDPHPTLGRVSGTLVCVPD